MSTIIIEHKIDGTLTDATSVKLSDPTGTYGVKRLDTDAVVVADDTAMTKSSTGIYEYEFDDPANDLEYGYYVEIVYEGKTYRSYFTFDGPTSSEDSEQYATSSEGDDYFDNQLNVTAWTDAETADKNKALKMATQIIDNLNYRGEKNDEDQTLQFPRLDDDEVPQDIKDACCEIAIRLLDGVDPELELENLRIVKDKYANIEATYSQSVPEYILAGVPSSKAWRYLKPYLNDHLGLDLSRET